MITAIYVVQRAHRDAPHLDYALSRARAMADRLVLVGAEDACAARVGADLNLPFRRGPKTVLAGYQIALNALQAEGAAPDHILLTGSHVFGPIAGFEPLFGQLEAAGGDLLAPYWHDLGLDKDLVQGDAPARVPYLDCALLGPGLLARPDFWRFWADIRFSEDPAREFHDGLVAFGRYCRDAGVSVCYPVADTEFETEDPRHFEIHKVVAAGGPVIPVSAFFLDPLLHDANATYLRQALDGLREAAPALYDLVIGYVVTHLKARDFCMISDQYAVLADHSAHAGKTEWGFGRVAVFIHAYYANMMPEFWELIGRLPCAADLYISTSSPEDKAHIEGFLADHGWPAAHADVREVEVNRGRDMSALFITFRDVIAADRHEVALRLHSKRTPQVSRQVGESFKDHLFENLVSSPDYVRNLLDMLEAEPDIGLVIPPVIQIGFGTLGHSWFNNRTPLQKIAAEMGLKIPLDDHTPVTAYGTMYWFRTDALRRMFEWPWKWEDYNPEPNHFDGGLAHVQERMIGYIVQDRGYRTVSVMTQKNAARNYAKLEYKMQLLTSYLASGNIYLQRQQLDTMAGTGRMRLYRRLQNIYGGALRRFPGARRYLRPLARHVQSVLRPGKIR